MWYIYFGHIKKWNITKYVQDFKGNFVFIEIKSCNLLPFQVYMYMSVETFYLFVINGIVTINLKHVSPLSRIWLGKKE